LILVRLLIGAKTQISYQYIGITGRRSVGSLQPAQCTQDRSTRNLLSKADQGTGLIFSTVAKTSAVSSMVTVGFGGAVSQAARAIVPNIATVMIALPMTDRYLPP
jgi:hypothetical protein